MLTDKKHLKENPLYHYTTQMGLKGIIENKSLWATNILYLNDSAEFIHAVNLVRNSLGVIHEEDKVSKKEEELLTTIDKRLDDFETNRSIGGFCMFIFQK